MQGKRCGLEPGGPGDLADDSLSIVDCVDSFGSPGVRGALAGGQGQDFDVEGLQSDIKHTADCVLTATVVEQVIDKKGHRVLEVLLGTEGGLASELVTGYGGTLFPPLSSEHVGPVNWPKVRAGLRTDAITWVCVTIPRSGGSLPRCGPTSDERKDDYVDWALRVIRLIARSGGWWVVVHPADSLVWQMPAVVRMLELPGAWG